jgi:hypothetical protein
MTLALLRSGYDYNLVAQVNRCREALSLSLIGKGSEQDLFAQINAMRLVLGLPLAGTGSPADLIKEINDLIAPINAFNAIAPSGGVEILFQTVHLSSSNILNLHTTPINLVSAQGVGTLILPLWLITQYNFGTVAYTISGLHEDAVLKFNGVTGAIDDQSFISIDGATASYMYLFQEMTFNDAAGLSGVNKAIVVAESATSAYISGNGTLDVMLYYAVLEV